MKKKYIVFSIVGGLGVVILSVIASLCVNYFAGQVSYKGAYTDSYYAPSMTNGISAGFGASSPSFAPDLAMSDVAGYDAYAPEVVSNSTSSGSDVSVSSGRKLIRRATVDAETTEYDKYVSWLDSHVSKVGGYFENKESTVHEWGYDSREYRTLRATIRVPSSALDGFLNDIESEGNVTYRNESQDDITDSYTDTDAHLASLRIEQTRLNELLSQAETIEDILAIEDRLGYIRYEVESYERQLRGYDSLIDYSVVTLDIIEVLEYTEPEPEGFFARCWNTFVDNALWLAEFLQDTFVFVIGHIPAIASGVVVVFISAKCYKRLRSKKAKKQEKVSGENDAL